MSVEHVKAAKEHRCDWCGGAIDKGTTYAAISVSSTARYGYSTRYKAHKGCASEMRRVNYKFTKFANAFEPVPLTPKTVVVTRDTFLRASSNELANVFICRVEFASDQNPTTIAFEQCFRHDLALWEAGERKDFNCKPRADLYRHITSFTGFPEITRPE